MGIFYCCIFLLLSKKFISYLHPILLHLVIVLLWCHCGAWCHSSAGVTPVSLRCWCYSGVTPVLVLLRCHSGAGATPVSLRCWCWCWCHSGVTPVLVLVLLRCHSAAGATLVSLLYWCLSKAGVLPVLPPPGVKKIVQIYYKLCTVKNNRSVTAVLSTKHHVQLLCVWSVLH